MKHYEISGCTIKFKTLKQVRETLQSVSYKRIWQGKQVYQMTNGKMTGIYIINVGKNGGIYL